MKHFTLISAVVAMAMMLTSCGEHSSAYKKLSAKYDSLQTVNENSNKNIEDILDMINKVDDNFQQINSATKSLALSKQNGELTQSKKQEIRNTMEMISSTLKANKEQLDKLTSELSKNKFLYKSLSKKLANMTKELTEKTALLSDLRNELAAKDIHINELDSTVNVLSENVRSLNTENTLQQKTINKQDAALHTAHYCFGYINELKEHKIITGGGLFSSAKVLPDGFDKGYLLPIDTREVTSIPLFAKKALIRTNHPIDSYEFIKDKEGNLILHIISPERFWDKSKYLVIEVK